MKTATSKSDRTEPARLVASVSEVLYAFPSGRSLLSVVAEDGSTVPALVDTGSAKPGDVVEMVGDFTPDPPPARCFLARSVATQQPARLDRDTSVLVEVLGIAVGEAQKLVAHFGADIFKILESRPEELTVIPGFERDMADHCANKWKTHAAQSVGDQLLKRLELSKQEREIVIAGIKRNHDGADINQVLTDNPYLPMQFSQTVSFRACDALARELKISPSAPHRIRALVLGALRDAARKGNTLIPSNVIAQRVVELSRGVAGITGSAVQEAIRTLVKNTHVTERGQFLAIPNVLLLEEKLLDAITRLEAGVPSFDPFLNPDAVTTHCKIAPALASVALQALQHRVCAIDGGDQPGRTAVATALMKILGAIHVRAIAIAANHAAAHEINQACGSGSATTSYAALKGKNSNDSEAAFTSIRAAQCIVFPDAHAMALAELQQLLSDEIAPNTVVCFIGRASLMAVAGSGMPYRALVHSKRIPVIDGPYVSSCAPHWWNRKREERARILSEVLPGFPILYFRARDENLLGGLEGIGLRVFKSFGVQRPQDIQVFTPSRDVPPTPESHNALLRKLLNPGAEASRVLSGSIAVGDPLCCMAGTTDPPLPAGTVVVARSVLSASKVIAAVGEIEVPLEGDALVKTFVHYIGPIQTCGASRPKVAVVLAPNHDRGFHCSLPDAIGAAIDSAAERLLVIGSDRGFTEPGSEFGPFFSGIAAAVRAQAPAAAAA